MKGKTKQDWILLAIQIITPIAGILCAIFIKPATYTIDHRLATIVAGITIPIITQGFWAQIIRETIQKNIQENVLQKNAITDTQDLVKTSSSSINNAIEKCSTNISELKKELSYSEEYSRIMQRGEKRRIQYAQRRLDEFKEVLFVVADGIETPVLSVSTYYYELNALKKELDKDPHPERCRIWAMTGFSNKEWDVDDNTLEKEWCDSLMELVKKITTDRICIIDPALEKKFGGDEKYYELQKKEWDEHQDQPELITNKDLKSFFDYVHAYYGADSHELKVNNYFLKKVPSGQATQTKTRLIEARGLFGIKLSDGTKYVIKGEAVDPQTGLQGQYVFSDTAVDDLYKSHSEGCKIFEKLDNYLKTNKAVSEAFRAFLKKNGVILDR